MTMNKRMLATAIALGLGLSGAALADPTPGGDGSPHINVNNGSTATYGDPGGIAVGVGKGRFDGQSLRPGDDTAV